MSKKLLRKAIARFNSEICPGRIQRLFAICLIFLSSFVSSFAQLIVHSNVGAINLVKGMTGTGLTFSNIQLNCDTFQCGTFGNGSATNLGFNNGIILTTGQAIGAIGPNDSLNPASYCVGTNYSDPNLIAIDPQAHYDPCVLEFDIVPQCNTLTLRFVFGSGEYPDYVGSNFNDAFGFFITGPNPAGPAYSGTNIAVLPNGTPVTINNVNDGSSNSGPCTNCQYYVNNSGGATIQYTGMTTVLTVSVALVPCQTYHFKAAIADAGDCDLDSGVFIDFIECSTSLSTVLSTIPAGCVCSGSATVIASQGIPPYSFLWVPSGDTTNKLNNICAGTYTCVVKDGTTCGTGDTVMLTVPGGSSNMAVRTTQTNVRCANSTDGTATATVTGGTAPYTYSWSPAPGGGQGTATAMGLAPGAYTCTVTDTGCVVSQTVIIAAPSPLAAPNTPTNVSCNGGGNGSVTVAPTGGTGAYTYSWSPAPAAGTFATTSNLTAGSYTCTITDANGCTITSPVTIAQPPLLTLNAAEVNATCSGKCNGQLICIPAGGTSTFSFSWNTGCLQSSCMNVCAGTYTATVTDANGCTSTDTALIKEPTPLAMNMVATPANCNKPTGHDSVFVSGGTVGYTYSWTPGPNSASSAYAALVPGTYTVFVNDYNGCRDSMSNTVSNIPGVVVASKASTPDTCAGSNNGTATVTATGGSPAYTYSWTPAAAIGGGGNTPTASGLVAGTYTCAVTDSTGCVSITTLTIKQPPPVTLALNSPAPICIGACTTIVPAGSGGTPGYTYIYSHAGTTLASGMVCPMVTSTYTVNCNDSHGCATTPAQVTVTVYPPVEVVAAGGKQICPGTATSLDAMASLGNGGPYTYSWTPSAGLDNPTLANPTATPAASPTTYTAIVTDGCTFDSAVVTLTLFAVPVVSFTSKDSLKCGGPVCVDFAGTSTPTCLTATWDFGDNSPLATTCNTATHCYNKAGNYTMTYSIIDADGCPGRDSAVNFINALPFPDADFSVSPQPTSILDPQVFFTYLSRNSAVDTVIAWAWTFGDFTGASSSIKNPNYTYPDTGCFPVQLIVTDLKGCKDTIVHPVCIQPYFTFYAPNTFTPNGDGLNDTWSPNGIGIDPNNYHLMMFDRWGNLLWETYTWLEGWDGKVNGGAEIAQIDTYVWKVDLKDVFHAKHQYIGHCNIIR